LTEPAVSNNKYKNQSCYPAKTCPESAKTGDFGAFWAAKLVKNSGKIKKMKNNLKNAKKILTLAQ